MKIGEHKDVERGLSPEDMEKLSLVSESPSPQEDELFGLTERSDTSTIISMLGSKAIPAIISLTLSLGGTFFNLLFAGRFVHNHIDHSVIFAGISLATMFTNVSCISLIIGMSSAVETLCSQHNGAGNYREVGLVLQRSCTFLMLFMIPMLVVWMEIHELCIYIGTAGDVCQVLKNYIYIRMLSVPVDVVNYSYEKFLMSIGVMEVSMYANILFNVCVLTLNCIFVFGFGGGYECLAWSWVIATYIAASYQYTASLAHIEVRRVLQPFEWKEAFSNWGEYIWLGVPGTIMMCSEWWAFEALILMSSFLGTAAVAAQSIIIQIAAISFMAPLGIGITAASFVGNAMGAGKMELAKRVGRVGLIFAFACSTVVGILIFFFGGAFIGLYTSDEGIKQIAIDAAPFLAIFVIMDGQQAVASGVLRGCGKQQIGAYTNVIAFYLLGLPMAYYVCFKLGLGVDGLIIGISSGSVLQLTVLYSTIFLFDHHLFDKKCIHSNAHSYVELGTNEETGLSLLNMFKKDVNSGEGTNKDDSSPTGSTARTLSASSTTPHYTTYGTSGNTSSNAN